MLLEPLPGVHQLRAPDDISLFLVLLVELQIEIHTGIQNIKETRTVDWTVVCGIKAIL